MARFATSYEALNNISVVSSVPLQTSVIKYTILIYTFTLKKSQYLEMYLLKETFTAHVIYNLAS